MTVFFTPSTLNPSSNEQNPKSLAFPHKQPVKRPKRATPPNQKIKNSSPFPPQKPSFSPPRARNAAQPRNLAPIYGGSTYAQRFSPSTCQSNPHPRPRSKARQNLSKSAQTSTNLHPHKKKRRTNPRVILSHFPFPPHIIVLPNEATTPRAAQQQPTIPSHLRKTNPPG